MQIPTYSKFGLTKSQIESKDIRDRRVSDILTHHLTIFTGSAFGITIYVLNYSKIDPSNLFQMIVQVFLFASIGVMCVGVPAILFKFIELSYFKIVESGDEHKTIERFKQERNRYDFWKLRQDYSFWRLLDGLSFEKEVMNILLNSGFSVCDDQKDITSNTLLIEKDAVRVYVVFNTRALEISDKSYIDTVLDRMNTSGCSKSFIFSQRGFSKKIREYSESKNTELFDIRDIITKVKSLNVNNDADTN